MKTLVIIVIALSMASCIEAPCPKKTCGDFLSWEEAQARYDACPESYENLFQNEGDTIACQSFLIDRTRRSNP